MRGTTREARPERVVVRTGITTFTHVGTIHLDAPDNQGNGSHACLVSSRRAGRAVGHAPTLLGGAEPPPTRREPIRLNAKKRLHRPAVGLDCGMGCTLPFGGRVVVLTAVLLIGVSGCSQSHPSTGRTTPSKANQISEIAEPSTNGPAVCHLLAQSVSLRELPSAMALRADPSVEDQASTVITSSAADLAHIAKTVSGSLASQLRATAVALAPLAKAGPLSASANDAAVQSLSDLAEEVQGTCDFPVT